MSAPIYLGNIVDAIVNGLKNSENMEAILHVANNTILILIGLYSGHAICTYASEYIILHCRKDGTEIAQTSKSAILCAFLFPISIATIEAIY